MGCYLTKSCISTKIRFFLSCKNIEKIPFLINLHIVVRLKGQGTLRGHNIDHNVFLHSIKIVYIAFLSEHALNN